MKLTSRIKRKSGMTLLELTVVILVLLSLIVILFVGARAWKKGSDRAGCILNIRNVQQAMRGHANMNNIAVGAALTVATIYSDDGTAYLKTPKCPSALPADTGGYTAPTAVVPTFGTLWLVCKTADAATHVPTGYSDW
jgi:type II secretory pathway pseudopilin PulG